MLKSSRLSLIVYEGRSSYQSDSPLHWDLEFADLLGAVALI